MDILDCIAEQRIAEATARGEFDRLPGVGQPLDLSDEPLVPPELRMAYRILKNAGYVPDEVRLLAEIGTAERLLAHATNDDERVVGAARLRLLLERLGDGRGGSLRAEHDYFERLVARLDDRSRNAG